jgi:aspartate aminotransferase
MMASPTGHEYLPLLGLPGFRQKSAELVFGADSEILRRRRAATIQTISGSGAVHVGAVFLKQFHKIDARVYVSAPSWPNHRAIFEHVGFHVEDYSYYDHTNRRVDFHGIMLTLEDARPGDIVVLHACAHNPTGCDFTQEQWIKLGQLLRRKELFPVLDSAYQGFASGDLDLDAWSIRHLLEEMSLSGIVCQSFSKSMGLYGERVGALHVVTSSKSKDDISDNVESQLAWISRRVISNAGRYGATIATLVMTEPALFAQWRRDLKTMADRIGKMRELLVQGLEYRQTPGTWQHITSQVGMFSYTGLPASAIRLLREEHIYMSETGRASICGLNQSNIDRFCDALHAILSREVNPT